MSELILPGTIVWFNVKSHPGIRFVGRISDSLENKKAGSLYTLRCLNDTEKLTHFTILRAQVNVCEDQTELPTKCPTFTEQLSIADIIFGPFLCCIVTVVLLGLEAFS